ncbi:hypothetical protein F5Y15DRAFT_407752 [Xylariaceae sp. FL0016]|nr:hypothetical protein F5Y15DRAFT_407752 [Xylariaceae sp. FL0016]
MFGGLANLVQPSTIGPPPQDVPPPTLIRLPQCNPKLPASSKTSSGTLESADAWAAESLVRFLQTIHRPTMVSDSHFAALGVHVQQDAPAEEVLPDPSYLPSAEDWGDIDLDETRRRDQTFRRPLSNGNLSPEARSYWERRNELSIANQAAFRTVRRIKPEPGQQQPRLGNCYEFFKQLELMATFWDDTSLPLVSSTGDDVGHQNEKPTSLFPRAHPHPHPIDASLDQVGHAAISAAAESNTRSDPETQPKGSTVQQTTFRTGAGNQMPPEFRHSTVAAFVKLVTYDFGCNIAPPRVEPRLHIVAPSPKSILQDQQSPTQPASYFPSGCVFLFRTPNKREAARSGIVEGPVAALSARNTTSFTTPTESRIDFGRELIAALITAQHRARAGKTEQRVGEGKWWATAKRWGGGEGGPIGREIEGDPVVAPADVAMSPTVEAMAPTDDRTLLADNGMGKSRHPPLPVRGPPLTKRPRKNLSMYDSYRMVRLPSSNWDKKVQYEAIGQVPGADFDDVFVLSSLFHHFCVLRVRVPRQLLGVLDGDGDTDGRQGSVDERERGRSWGKLNIWRSRWFDLFKIDERLEAMRLLWGLMAYIMRDTRAGSDSIGETMNPGSLAC